ncbi:MAG: IS630 family transposase [Bacteroidota bacterium]|nr:IS630 family transposase [Bacteroidota bacterium]
MVLKYSEGQKTNKIAEHLGLHHHSVRKWLKNYKENGIKGLKRKFAPGKTKDLRIQVQKEIESIIEKPPSEFGYPVNLWTTALLKNWLAEQRGIFCSQDTLERALKDSGYSYKRSGKKVSERAPSKEEKLEKMSIMLDEIKAKIKKGNCEIFALDESHFSNEPYVVKGWQKKLWFKTDSNASKAGKKDNIWLLEFKDRKILLEECYFG